MGTRHSAARAVVVALACTALATPALAQVRTLDLCVVEQNVLRKFTATWDAASNDYLIDGKSFYDRFPNAAFAPARDWFKHDSRNFLDKDYLKYGLPRQIEPRELRLLLHHTGVPVFVENSAEGRKADVVYVASGPACEFQPYSVASAEELHARAAAAYAERRYESALATLLLKTVEQHGPSRVLMGHMYITGAPGLSRDTTSARRMFQRGIDAGDPDGYAGFARLATIAGKDAAALALYRTAADFGSGAGAAELAMRYRTGRGIAASPQEAAYYLRIALDRLDERSPLLDSARTALADLYATGRGVQRDASAHYADDLAAATNGAPWAQYLMGRRYELGMAVIRSDAVAIGFYTPSAKRGYAPSVRALGRLQAR